MKKKRGWMIGFVKPQKMEIIKLEKKKEREKRERKRMLGMTKTIHCIFLREKVPLFKKRKRKDSARPLPLAKLQTIQIPTCRYLKQVDTFLSTFSSRFILKPYH